MSQIALVGGIEGKHNLYVLIHRETGRVFYVGVSVDPWKRSLKHSLSGESSAFERIREIMQNGGTVEMVVLVSFEDRAFAKRVEAKLVAEYPSLQNRRGNPWRDRSCRVGRDAPERPIHPDRKAYMRELMRKRRAAARPPT